MVVGGAREFCSNLKFSVQNAQSREIPQWGYRCHSKRYDKGGLHIDRFGMKE